MKQCAARQFENELVERLSILASRHLRPPAPERGPHSTAVYTAVHVVLNLVRTGVCTHTCTKGKTIQNGPVSRCQ